MAPRSQLEIATSSVERLVKEEASYHRELQQQTERIQKLESQEAGEDENREYMLKQERLALEETKKVLPSLKQKIDEAVAKLESLLVSRVCDCGSRLLLTFARPRRERKVLRAM
jgi:tubulin-specific chaperone A